MFMIGEASEGVTLSCKQPSLHLAISLLKKRNRRNCVKRVDEKQTYRLSCSTPRRATDVVDAILSIHQSSTQRIINGSAVSSTHT